MFLLLLVYKIHIQTVLDQLKLASIGLIGSGIVMSRRASCGFKVNVHFGKSYFGLIVEFSPFKSLTGYVDSPNVRC